MKNRGELEQRTELKFGPHQFFMKHNAKYLPTLRKGMNLGSLENSVNADSFPSTQHKENPHLSKCHQLRFSWERFSSYKYTCSFSSTVKDNLLVAQIFRHGDNLWCIKKFILVIFITHVPFARTALIYKEKSLICFLWLHLPMPGTVGSFKY